MVELWHVSRSLHHNVTASILRGQVIGDASLQFGKALLLLLILMSLQVRRSARGTKRHVYVMSPTITWPPGALAKSRLCVLD